MTNTPTNDPKAALAKRQAQPLARADTPANTIAGLFKQLKPQLEQALPKHLTADRLLRVALFQIRNTPKLMECDPMSLVAAVTQSAQLGLEPGILGHAYFVPYGKQVQFILGYRGMIELARRSGSVKTIDAHEVYANDTFEYEYGLTPKLLHKPCLGDRGKVIAYYGVVNFTDGGYVFTVMSLGDIEKYRKRSKASSNGPWVTDYDAMAIKTVIRRLFRWMPCSIEMQEAMAHDSQVVTSVKANPLGELEILADYPDGVALDAVPEVTTPESESFSRETGEVYHDDGSLPFAEEPPAGYPGE